jgi:hypothetical protein
MLVDQKFEPVIASGSGHDHVAAAVCGSLLAKSHRRTVFASREKTLFVVYYQSFTRHIE